MCYVYCRLALVTVARWCLDEMLAKKCEIPKFPLYAAATCRLCVPLQRSRCIAFIEERATVNFDV